MRPIELPIFHHTDESHTLKDCGIDYSIQDCEIRQITFYHISAISPYKEGDKEYGCVHSNGQEFICKWDYETTKRLIHENI